MRFRAKVIVAALVMIPAVLTQTPARADWCAQYSDGLENCGFSTFEQCRASMGIKGFCRPSQYNPGYASAGRADKKTKVLIRLRTFRLPPVSLLVPSGF